MVRCPIILVVFFVFVMGVGPARAAEDFGDGAERFISDLAHEAITSLTGSDMAADEREQRFRDIMARYIALKGIAIWVVGRKVWKRASEDQQNRYLGLFEDLMVATYAHRFADYSGQTLEVKGTEVFDGKDALVRTEMVRPGATQALDVGWRVRAKNGEYKIVDIMVAGLSMARKQRSEFASFLRQHDDDIAALNTELQMRLQAAQAVAAN